MASVSFDTYRNLTEKLRREYEAREGKTPTVTRAARLGHASFSTGLFTPSQLELLSKNGK